MNSCLINKKVFLILLIFLLLLTGCASKSNTSGLSDSEFGSEKQNYNFVFVCPILENEYWELCMKGIRRADSELGTETRVIGPPTADNFTSEIIGYMKEAIDSKPSGIMAYAGIEDMFPLIDKASEQGIPVIALDSDAPSTSRIAYVGADDYNLGYNAGEEMAKLAGEKAKIGIMVSSMSAEREMRVVEAFLDAVDDYDAEIVAVTQTDANIDTAVAKAREMLSEHPEITAMFNTAGYNVTGAARIKKELGRDDLILVGFDDTVENLQYVREGVINAVFAQRVEEMGYQGVYLMKEYLDNGVLPKEKYDLGSILVNKENVYSYSTGELASEGAGKKVRVGYYTGISSFQDGFDDDTRKSGYAYEYYQAIATLTGWKYEYVYGNRSDIFNMLINGEVDIMAGVYRTDAREESVLFSKYDMGLDGDLRYFAVNKDRADLMTDLNHALDQMLQSAPDFAADLKQKYYSKATQQQILTDKEWSWLKERNVLKIGYIRYNLPFSDRDKDGAPTGVIKDLMELLSGYLHIRLEPVCYENIADMESGLRFGEIDIAFPMYSDVWISEVNGFMQTDSFISDRVMIVYQGSYSSDLLNRVALSPMGMNQKYYLSAYYPNTKIEYYPTREEAFEAIRRGEEKCIVGCSSILQRFLVEHSGYKDMNIAYLDTSESFGMAVSRNNNLLAGILNKAIRQLDTATITSSMLYYSGVEPSYSFTDFLQQHSILVIGILCIFFAVLLMIFINYRRRTHIFNVEQSKTQAALEKALLDANAASNAKTTFLSSMSHDIRTPMNAIVGMTAIASRHLDEREKVRDCLEKIALSGHHLLTLINDVLDISKIESGKLAINPVVFSLRDTVTTLINIVRSQLQAKRLQFDVYIHGMEYEYVYADELRVNQIFINILSNAVKYTLDGGKVVMDLTERLLPGGEKVRLTYKVEDTGIGMSEEFMSKMYDTFVRAEDSRINKTQGTGLGLAIVKQMVDIMNGTIECRSEEEKGTSFKVVLDLPVEEREKEKTALKDVSILLVDSDKIFLESASRTLRSIAAAVETAESGAFAVDMVKDKHIKAEDYRVIIISREIADMNNREIFGTLRSIMGKNMPAVLICDYDWDNIEENIEESGADGFISKPVFQSRAYEELCGILDLTDKYAETESVCENDLKGRHLLIAEDNELNWEVISELLDMYGISAERAENGRICVDMLTAAPPGTYDLILMDIQMPVMNGRDASRAIRNDERDYVRDIPIIAMTADAFAEDIAASLEAGMDGHISKPVDMDNLCQEMRKVLYYRM